MRATHRKIVKYLEEFGRMSGRDICYDLDIDEVDVDAAYYDGVIVKVDAPHGARAQAWYDVARGYRK